MSFESVVFDVDGTLLDTSEGILSSVEHVIHQEGLPLPSNRMLRTFIGPPIEDSFQRVYGLDRQEAQRLASLFRKQYQAEDLLKASPYEGIFNVLDELKKRGIKMAIATYKRQDYARTLLENFGFDQYCYPIYGSDPEGQLKKSDIIKMCFDSLGIEDVSDALMIGDTYHDAIGAYNLNTPFLAVTYGFGFEDSADVSQVESIGAANTAIEILDYI